jgi:type IV secretory pathway VirB4 component
VDRPGLLDRLHETVRSGSGLTAIVGPAGIGKTVLAAAYARSSQAAEDFSDGVFWFDAGRYERALNQTAGRRLFIFDSGRITVQVV